MKLYFIFLGIDDLQICRALLESKDWDLEATAREQFDPQDPSERTREQPIGIHDEAPGSSNYQSNLQPSRMLPAMPPQGSHSPIHTRHVTASNSSSNSRSNYQVNRDANIGASGILRWGFYLITLPIAWPVRIAYNTVTNIFGFISDLLGFGHLFGHFRQGIHPRGRRYLPRPPATDPKGIINLTHSVPMSQISSLQLHCLEVD